MLPSSLIFLAEMFAMNLVCAEDAKPIVNKFVQNSAACRIPDLYQWEFNKFYKPKAYVPCNVKVPLASVERIEDRYFVVTDPSVMSQYSNSSAEISCWINNITRGLMSELPDNEIRESRAVPFEYQTKAEITKDVVKVKCYKVRRNEAKVIYENVFGTYVPFNIVERRYPMIKEPFSVLIVIVDSLSKYSFVKMMPKTFEYLKSGDFKLLYGYSQLDRVALPNIVPLLTGYSMQEAVAKFGSPLDTFFDTYDFVWYDYEKYGYVTAFAEDFGTVNTFNRQYKGFWSRPTDFYFRPLTIAADLLTSTYLDGMPHCSGPESGAERILKLASDFVVTFKSKPYFGLFWLNSFSHDDFSAPSRMDAKMRDFFQGAEPYRNNTIVFFLSDHGYSKESIADDPTGLYESKSPLGLVYLPKTFRAKYAEMAQKFEENCKKLVSPYDIYATLQDILLLSDTNHAPKRPTSCPKCKSLFREIVNVRTCKDAGVDDEWCICWREGTFRSPDVVFEERTEKRDVGNKEIRESAASRLFDKMSYFGVKSLCAIIVYSLIV